MALTPSDVKDGFPTTVPDAEISALIAFFGGADECLSLNSVDAETQDTLKKYAIRHLLSLQANGGRGQVSSESAPSGASRSFASWSQGQGLEASPYGLMVKQMDKYGCIRSLVENDQNLALMSVGPCRKRRGRR